MGATTGAPPSYWISYVTTARGREGQHSGSVGAYRAKVPASRVADTMSTWNPAPFTRETICLRRKSAGERPILEHEPLVACQPTHAVRTDRGQHHGDTTGGLVCAREHPP